MSIEMDDSQGAPRRGPRGANGADKKGGSSVRKRGFTAPGAIYTKIRGQDAGH